ncbi:translation initiation factor IF-2 [Cytobacillus kochii]|uniref:translation initiation factor IF-2 n=1 Tax=Cytobacillus kochii TaxID=859143 RepID=UPI002E2151F4|nr:translation initiation factor IF-2 [Cytobacillus kochii]MED1606529.1 translation initiation factor IF-2 [Cytobacillus kochii]
MSKIRVYEYAKKHNLSSKDVITKLKEMNIEVSNHMTTLEPGEVTKLDGIYNKQEEKQPQKQQSAQAQPANNQKNKPAGAPKGNRNKPNNNNNNNNKNQKPNRNNNQKNKPKNKGQKPPQPPAPKKVKELPEKITFTESLTVGELAKKLHREPSEIIKKLFMLGVMATINQELDKDSIELIAGEYGVDVEEEVLVDVTDLEAYFTEDEETNLEERPSVVTIMGHVDHGKTTLLDSIRHTKVTAGEAGGITQHIGAYQVEDKGKKITFLDTPGHAAFTTMRARGAKITDITILVVAADDGVMPQTIEAINHAKAAEVPIIVAVNKMDKEAANPDRVMQELTEHGLVPEAWGGDTIFVPISAIKGDGIDELLEMILLVGEVEEYKANPNRNAVGTVIEAQLDKGRGSVATLLVQNGTLKVGDPIVVGNTFGRVRAMVNDLGRRVKTAGPSTPVEITGLNDVPQAGDRFAVLEDEKSARQVGEARAQLALQAQRSEKSRVSLDNLFEHMKEGEMKDINIVVKADVQGSAEALTSALNKIDVEGVKVRILHTGAGAINESDITLAAAFNAIVIGFNVRPDTNAKRAAEAEDVDIRLHRIIYNVIEEIELAMKGMLDPEFEEKIIGQAEVRQTFKVSKIGTIAGSYVTEGKITRDSGIRLIRDGVVIFEGEIDALKRFKDDAKEVATNYECGITIKNYNDVKEGDIIEAYIMQEIERK